MASKLILLLTIVFFIHVSSFSQAKTYDDILPKNIKALPVLDTINYLPDSLKEYVFNVLKAENFDLTKCFSDKEISFNKKDQTISIRIWDIDYLRNAKKNEKSKKLIPYEYSHSGFYSGTIEYDPKTKTAKFYGDQ